MWHKTKAKQNKPYYYFLISTKENESLHKTYSLLIQYLYTDRIIIYIYIVYHKSEYTPHISADI